MAESWATSTVLVKQKKFNWKINDLTPLFYASKAAAEAGSPLSISSPVFHIGDNKCWLLIEQKNKQIKDKHLSDYNDSCIVLTREGNKEITTDYQDYHIVTVEVKSDKENFLTGGSLNIDMKQNDGNTLMLSGNFGETSRKTIETDPVFRNLKNDVYIARNYRRGYRRLESIDHSFFSISRLATEIKVRVELYFLSPIINTITDEPTKDSDHAKLSADMKAVLDRVADFSDFTIECGGKIFPCHELILRARSTVLDTMFQNKMKETGGRSMSVVDVGPGTMAAVLEYMYTGELTVEVDIMKELIYIADKYEMEELLKICFQKLPEIGDDMIVDFLFMADKHNFVEYKKAAMARIYVDKAKFMKDREFVEKLREVPDLMLELLEY